MDNQKNFEPYIPAERITPDFIFLSTTYSSIDFLKSIPFVNLKACIFILSLFYYFIAAFNSSLIRIASALVACAYSESEY